MSVGLTAFSLVMGEGMSGFEVEGFGYFKHFRGYGVGDTVDGS